MYPAVRPPKKLLGRSIDLKLKPGWRFDDTKGVFVNSKGEEFAPPRLPKGSRLVYTVPSLARAAAKRFSKAEKDLQRYMQAILPSRRSSEDLAEALKALPAVEEAHVTPEISLPREKIPGRKGGRR
jgi:hypothetical protein